MKPTYLLDDIFGSRGRVKVLRCLAGVQVPLSIRQVARQSGMSHVAAGAVLDDLVGMGLVAASTAGRSRVHWLECRSLYVERVVLPVFAAETAMPEALITELRAVAPEGVTSVVLFGSYARGDQTPLSDVGLLLVAESDSTLTKALEHLDEHSTQLRARLGARVSVLGYTLEAAVRLVQQGDNLMDGVVRDGLVVTGSSPAEWNSNAQGASDRSA